MLFLLLGFSVIPHDNSEYNDKSIRYSHHQVVKTLSDNSNILVNQKEKKWDYYQLSRIKLPFSSKSVFLSLLFVCVTSMTEIGVNTAASHELAQLLQEHAYEILNPY